MEEFGRGIKYAKVEINLKQHSQKRILIRILKRNKWSLSNHHHRYQIVGHTLSPTHVCPRLTFIRIVFN